jgi:iron complex transport system permease protein
MKDTIWIKKGRFTPLALLLMLALPLVTSVVCLCFGRMNVPVGEVLTALRTALTVYRTIPSSSTCACPAFLWPSS